MLGCIFIDVGHGGLGPASVEGVGGRGLVVVVIAIVVVVLQVLLLSLDLVELLLDLLHLSAYLSLPSTVRP